MPVIHTFQIWEIKHAYLKGKINHTFYLSLEGKIYFTYVLMKYATENNYEIDVLKYL